MATSDPYNNSAWVRATTNMNGLSQAFSNLTGSSSGTTISGGTTVNIGGLQTTPPFIAETKNPRPLKAQWCEISGHMMSSEVEWDGFILGKCENCGEKMMGRRLPGGLAVERLRLLLEVALEDQQTLMDLCTDVLRMQELIDAEERALAEAKSLLTLAREKVRQRAVQPKRLKLSDITES